MTQSELHTLPDGQNTEVRRTLQYVVERLQSPDFDFSRWLLETEHSHAHCCACRVSFRGRSSFRGPVILDPESYDLWLDPGMQNVAAISELLKPYDASRMQLYPVSSRVNHVTNDDEECSRRVEITEAQNRLFA
jgi:hypothetical protein